MQLISGFSLNHCEARANVTHCPHHPTVIAKVGLEILIQNLSCPVLPNLLG